MNTLLEEKAKTDRRDIRIVSSGCIGKCDYEPIVTVETGEGTVVYQKIDPDKMQKIFSEHIINGNVQTDYLMPKQA
jgi:NADP-reducing hydrogenase subunit HndB